MKTTVHYFKQVSFVAFLILFVGSYSIGNAQDKENAKPETELHPEIFWDVKAYRPETTLLQVKAVDKDGNYHDVKAIQYSERKTRCYSTMIAIKNPSLFSGAIIMTFQNVSKTEMS